MSAAALCVRCTKLPRMPDWSAVPPDAPRHVCADAAGAPTLCAPCWHAQYRDPRRLATVQTHAALDALARPASAFVRWPFRDLDALTGPLPPKSVHYVAAASGGGKSTFITAAIDGWLAAGVHVDVLPLEADAWDWRKHFAAVRAGVPPGDVLSGELEARADHGDAEAARLLDAVRDQLRRMHKATQADPLLGVHPDRRLSARTLAHLFGVIAARGGQVVVVDHIDHLVPDPAARGGSGLDESQRVNNTLLDAAKDHGLIAVAMSQLNAARFAGTRDRLAKYALPQTRDLYMHTFKEHNATTILGLYRPLDPAGDADLLARARAGEVEPQRVLAPGVMGVGLLKSRPYGQREGQRAYLTVERGAARERTDDERRAWDAAQQGIATGDTHRRGPAPRLGVVRGAA